MGLDIYSSPTHHNDLIFNIQYNTSPHFQCSHEYQKWKGDASHNQYVLHMQQSVMEHHHTGVDTIVQSTWCVQTRKVIEKFQVMGITAGGGWEKRSGKREEEGYEMG